MGKVLYITHDGLCDALGQSQIIPYLEGLSRKNHEITVISSEKPGKYARLKEDISQRLKQSGIRWIPTTYSSSFPLFSQFRNFRKLKKTAFAACSEQQPELVHCRSYIAA